MSMDYWEYKYVRLDGVLEAELNKYGRYGWELVAITTMDNCVSAVMKRKTTGPF